MEKLHITPENIARWLEQLIGSGRSVYAPVRTGERVDFKKIARPEEVASDYVQTTQSVKKVVFPRTEELFSYRKEGKQVSVRQPDLRRFPKRSSGKSGRAMRPDSPRCRAYSTGITRTVPIMRAPSG